MSAPHRSRAVPAVGQQLFFFTEFYRVFFLFFGRWFRVGKGVEWADLIERLSVANNERNEIKKRQQRQKKNSVEKLGNERHDNRKMEAN